MKKFMIFIFSLLCIGSVLPAMTLEECVGKLEEYSSKSSLSEEFKKPLYLAIAVFNSKEMCELLLANGHDRNEPIFFSHTPLDVARNRGAEEIYQFLLSKGARHRR